ncbi:MAG: hypothetical protein ACI4BH_06190 [Muribaculaceae bacterium]
MRIPNTNHTNQSNFLSRMTAAAAQRRRLNPTTPQPGVTEATSGTEYNDSTAA